MYIDVYVLHVCILTSKYIIYIDIGLYNYSMLCTFTDYLYCFSV